MTALPCGSSASRSHGIQTVNRWRQNSDIPGHLSMIHHVYQWCEMLESSQDSFFLLSCRSELAQSRPCWGSFTVYSWWETPGEAKGVQAYLGPHSSLEHIQALFPATSPIVPKVTPGLPVSKNHRLSHSWQSFYLSGASWWWRSSVSVGVIAQWWSQISPWTGHYHGSRYYMNIWALPLPLCFFWVLTSIFRHLSSYRVDNSVGTHDCNSFRMHEETSFLYCNRILWTLMIRCYVWMVLALGM